MRREVLAQKGNSPKYLLRSLNKDAKYGKRFEILEGILFTKGTCVRMNCPGGWTVQRDRVEAQVREAKQKSREQY